MPTIPFSGVRSSWLMVTAKLGFQARQTQCIFLGTTQRVFAFAKRVHHVVEDLAHGHNVTRPGINSGTHLDFTLGGTRHGLRQAVQWPDDRPRQAIDQQQHGNAKGNRNREVQAKANKRSIERAVRHHDNQLAEGLSRTAGPGNPGALGQNSA